MWILKDFINDNIVPFLPWTLLFLALVIFCSEFVWTERKTLSDKQKALVKSFFACALAGFLTVWWAHIILPPEKQPILIACVILPLLIFLNNNFLKRHVIPKDWQIVLYICLVFVPLAVRDSALLVTGCALNCLFYTLANARSSSKKVNKTIKQIDTKQVKKSKTLYGGIILLSYALAVSIVFAYQGKSPLAFTSSLILGAVSLASFFLWYLFNDKERIHWFVAFQVIFLFLPFLFNPFRHFWIGSAIVIASLVLIEFLSFVLTKKTKKDRFFIFSLGLECLSILLSLGIACAGIFYQSIPLFALIIVNVASLAALVLYYILFGSENFWPYALLTIFLVWLSVFTSPFTSFWIICTALCVLLPLIIASFSEHRWLLIVALSALLLALTWICVMILAGQLDFDKIFDHVHFFGKITGRGMIQEDIIPYILLIALVPVLCIVLPFILELIFGISILVKRAKKLF